MSDNVPEVYSIQTADGKTFWLNDGSSRFILRTPGGWGFPPINWDTFQGYKQDGLNEIGFTLAPRTFFLEFEEGAACREDLWTARTQLINELRPNRTASIGKSGQHILTITYDGGDTLRSIYGRFSSPTYPDNGVDWFEFSIADRLNFTAFDPVWFNPTQVTEDIAFVGFDDWIFPAAFTATRMTFGAVGFWANAQINYNVGNWYSYPIVTIDGAFSSMILEHKDTGAIIELQTGAAAGQTVTLDIENVTVTRSDGADLINYLTPASDFVGFRFEPENIAPNGVNTIRITLTGTDGNTAIAFSYYERFIGI